MRTRNMSLLIVYWSPSRTVRAAPFPTSSCSCPSKGRLGGSFHHQSASRSDRAPRSIARHPRDTTVPELFSVLDVECFTRVISQRCFVQSAGVAGHDIYRPHLAAQLEELLAPNRSPSLSSSFSSPFSSHPYMSSAISRKILTSKLGPATWRSFSHTLPTLRDRPRMGDLNNTAAVREHLRPVADPEYRFRSFAIPPSDDDPAVRERYRPFLLDEAISESDWVAKLELATAANMVEAELLAQQKDRLRILVYGSLRTRFDPPTLCGHSKLTRNAAGHTRNS